MSIRRVDSTKESNEILNLDDLVDRLSESYGLSSSRVDSIKSGLEQVVTDYLQQELKRSNCSEKEFLLESLSADSVGKVMGQILKSEKSVVKLNESELIKLEKTSAGYTYQLLDGVDPSKLSTQVLIESWKCDENGVRRLFEEIGKQYN